MEDQQPGSGDLTAVPSQPPKRPVGKAARSAETRAAEQKSDDAEEQSDVAAAGAEAAEPAGEQSAEPTQEAAESQDETVEPADEAAESQDDGVEPADEVAAPAAEQADEAAEPADEANGDEDVEPADEDVEPADKDAEPADDADVVLEPHRPAGRRMMAAVVAAAVLFVGSSAFAGAMVQPYLSERALVETKLDIAETAVAAITTLWTYTPDDMAMLADRASRYLGGDFAEEYRRYIDAIVEPNKQAQVTNTTQVVGAAVESVSPPDAPSEATAIVYTNSVATSPVSKNIPSLRYLSYRLTMQRDGSRWLISRMSTVTSFDLTPQL